MRSVSESGSKRLTLFTIFSLSYFGSFGNPLIIPLYPRIMEHYQVGPLEISLLISVYALPGACVIPLLGFLQDLLGRKPILLGALLLCLAASFGLAFTDSFGLFLLGRALQGLAVTPLEALSHTLISDHCSGTERLKNIGRNVSALYIGVATFPLLSSATAWLFGWRYALLLPCVLGLPLFLLCLRLPMSYRQSEFKLGQYAESMRRLLTSRRLLSLFGLRIWTALIMFGTLHTYMPFFVMNRLGGGENLPGIYFALFSACLALGSISLGWMTLRFSTLRVALGSCLALAGSLLSFLLAPNALALIPTLVLYGASSGVITSLVTAYTALSATHDARATVLALNSTVFRAAQAVAPPLCGLLFSSGGFPLLYGTAAAAAFVMICLINSAFKTPPVPDPE